MAVYVVIEEDRGEGPWVSGLFKDESEAIAFAKKNGGWVQTSDFYG